MEQPTTAMVTRGAVPLNYRTEHHLVRFTDMVGGAKCCTVKSTANSNVTHGDYIDAAKCGIIKLL
jgi:hypothetical protein